MTGPRTPEEWAHDLGLTVFEFPGDWPGQGFVLLEDAVRAGAEGLDVKRLADALHAADPGRYAECYHGLTTSDCLIDAEAIATEYAATPSDARERPVSLDAYLDGMWAARVSTGTLGSTTPMYQLGFQSAVEEVRQWLAATAMPTGAEIGWCEACGYAHRPDDPDCLPAATTPEPTP